MSNFKTSLTVYREMKETDRIKHFYNPDQDVSKHAFIHHILKMSRKFISLQKTSKKAMALYTMRQQKHYA